MPGSAEGYMRDIRGMRQTETNSHRQSDTETQTEVIVDGSDRRRLRW